MYRNQAKIQVDDKSRIRLPTGFAEALGVDKLIITVHQDYYLGHYRCLVMYDLTKWETLERHIDRMPNNDVHKQRLENSFLGCAEECCIKSGKILLPSLLREQADITPKSTILMQSINKKYRLWSLANKQKLDAQLNQQSYNSSASDALNDIPF